MVFDPDNPSAHAESRADNFVGPQDPARKGERPPTVARRGPRNDVERWAGDALSVLSADAHQDLPDAVRSIGGQVLAYGPRLSEKQWAYTVSLAERFATRHALPKPLPPPPRSALELEASEVEEQLDALLRDPRGDRCHLANDEAKHRIDRIAGDIKAGTEGDVTHRFRAVGFGACGLCPIGRSCPRCSAGQPHPGEPCEGSEHSRHRNCCCRGISFSAYLQAKKSKARGDIEAAQEILSDMGLDKVSL